MKIQSGNLKLGKHVPNNATTPGKACGNCKYCIKDCYAMKAYKQYPNVRKAWDFNLKQAKTNRSAYFGSLVKYLTKKKPRMFRWHVAGDILDQNYLDWMDKIADMFPNTKFLAFTKMFKLDYSKAPDNLSIVWSAWPGMPMPERKTGVAGIAWMQNGSETRIPDNAIECSGNCEDCGMFWSLRDLGRDVYFHKH